MPLQRPGSHHLFQLLTQHLMQLQPETSVEFPRVNPLPQAQAQYQEVRHGPDETGRYVFYVLWQPPAHRNDVAAD